MFDGFLWIILPVLGVANVLPIQSPHHLKKGTKKPFKKNCTPEDLYDIAKSPFSTGNTSSNGGFSIVMLVFGGVPLRKCLLTGKWQRKLVGTVAKWSAPC